MKKLLSVILMLLMAASFAVPAQAGGVAPRDMSVVYTASTVDASDLGVGDSFYVYIDISQYSALWSGLWLLDYPEELVTPTAASSTFPGSLANLVQDSWDDDTAYSDKPGVLITPEYSGSYGEPGNMYSMTGMYLDSFQYGGVQMGGSFVRFKYRIDRLPTTAEAMHDENGYYIAFPLLVIESTYLVPGTTQTYVPHENVSVVNGKVYMDAQPVAAHTVSFYGYGGSLVSSVEVPDGQSVQAPAVPGFVETEAGTYAFYGWDRDLSCVTADMDVHAVYLLLGDVDMNGVVNSSDALLTLRTASGLHVLDLQQAFAADVSGDGSITSLDALKLARYVLGLVGSLAY